MKVSIIIPIYNASKYIERCLVSALNQSYSNVEYICVDDGSADDSLIKAKNIVEQSARVSSVVFIEHHKNKGVAEARNTGINQATGDYIYFLDSDDELPYNSIELLVKAKDSADADIVLGDFDMTGAEKSRFKTIRLPNGNYTGSSVLDSFLLMQWPDMTCNKLVKLETIRKNQIYFEQNIIHEDTLWSFILAVKSSLMVITDKVTYTYHIQGESITQKKTDHNFKSLSVVLDQMIFLSAENQLFEQDIHIRDYLIDFAYYFLKESIRCRKFALESKEVHNTVKTQLKKVDKLSQRINFSSKIKLFLIYSPYYLMFGIIRSFLHLKN